MKEREERPRGGPRSSPSEPPGRAAEQGDVAEPDAPTAAEENEGMSTILSGEPLSGVQKDAAEE